MADPCSSTPMLDDALELAELFKPSWEPMSRALRESGVPLNEGDGDGGGDGSGGDGSSGGDGDGNGEGGGKSGDGKVELSEADQKVISEAKDPDAVRNLITREREARQRADKKATEEAAKAKKLEDAKKSDQEKLEDERDTLKTEGADAKSEALRLRVAIEKKVPADLADRLRGETKEELEADADKLLEWAKSSATEDGDGTTSTSLDGGVRKDPPAEVQPGLGRLAHAYAKSGKK